MLCFKFCEPMSHSLWEAMFRVFVHLSSDNEVVYHKIITLSSWCLYYTALFRCIGSDGLLHNFSYLQLWVVIRGLVQEWLFLILPALSIVFSLFGINLKLCGRIFFVIEGRDVSGKIMRFIVRLKRIPRIFVVWHGKSSVEIILSELIIPFFRLFFKDEKREQKHAEFISEFCVLLFALSIGRFRWMLKTSLREFAQMSCFFQ